MYKVSSASSAAPSASIFARAATRQTVCTTSFGPGTENSAFAAAAASASSASAAFARYASSTGPVCAFSVAMFRTRSFSLSGRVRSWRRIRFAW